MIENGLSQSFQRYLFIEYTDLVKNSLKTFFKIADEIMVFLDPEFHHLPLNIVKESQRYCNRIQWVSLKWENEQEKWSSIAFILGQQHHLQDKNKEFAVYSETECLDHIIEHINDGGRNCIRIKDDSTKIDQAPDLFINMGNSSFITNDLTGTIQNEDAVNKLPSERKSLDSSGQNNHSDVDYLARKTLNRLIESGNRPAQVSTLKSYILLNNQEENILHRIDDIIHHLNSFSEIDINEDNIVYNLD